MQEQRGQSSNPPRRPPPRALGERPSVTARPPGVWVLHFLSSFFSFSSHMLSRCIFCFRSEFDLIAFMDCYLYTMSQEVEQRASSGPVSPHE